VIVGGAADERRLLLLAPTARDAATTHAMLSPLGVRVDICRTFEVLLQELPAGAGAILLPEEAASSARNSALRALLADQPPWSDLPVLILTRTGADSADSGEAVRTLGNVTLLERPVRLATLVSAVRSALRARDRQYQIREHLAERARAEESLRLADRRKDEFLATLGHELRNPLAPLLTALKLLKTTGTQDPVAIRVGAVMDRQVNHLVRLVNDLLEVSRITRGLIDVQREPLDLAFVVHSAVDTSRPAVDEAGHELSVELPAEPVTVYGDAVRLTQVFANLLTNAAKYTNAGGRIRIGVRREGGRALVSVRDNGIGIAADQLQAVFEMFTQVDRSNRRAQGGLGIGLTLVRSLVTMHGGRVEACSAGLGCGSEFVVDLPAVAERAATALEADAPAEFPRRRILVVDDNCDAAEMLADLLRVLGATVSVAHTGRAALDTLASFDPDAVLLDIGMPDMDGYEVARRIRATPDYRGVLLIALTGFGQEHDQRRSRDAGFDHHVVKPADIDGLRHLLMSGWSAITTDRGRSRDAVRTRRRRGTSGTSQSSAAGGDS
jgi:signal transduction histidine kinase/ActR/RegA family two-component response regulator